MKIVYHKLLKIMWHGILQIYISSINDNFSIYCQN